MTQCTWSKGKQGDWLVRGPIGLSGTVTVSKRDGSTSTASLGRCLWQSDGVALYAVAPRGRTYEPTSFGAPRYIRCGCGERHRSDEDCDG